MQRTYFDMYLLAINYSNDLHVIFNKKLWREFSHRQSCKTYTCNCTYPKHLSTTESMFYVKTA